MAASVLTPLSPVRSFLPSQTHHRLRPHPPSDAVAKNHGESTLTDGASRPDRLEGEILSPVNSCTINAQDDMSQNNEDGQYAQNTTRAPLVSPTPLKPPQNGDVHAGGCLESGYFDHELDFGNEPPRLVDPVPERFWETMVANSSGPTFGYDVENFDLKPPPPTTPHMDVASLTERLFSADHLRVIIKDTVWYARFESYVTQRKPSCLPALRRYRAFESALAAMDYAEAIVSEISPGLPAGSFSKDLQARAHSMVTVLVKEALPAYVTYRLIQILNETLVKEIIRESLPFMPFNNGVDLNSAEAYCITDPGLPDNPIVYASEGK